jgi:hypothetical protein
MRTHFAVDTAALRLPERERAGLAADLLASLPPPAEMLREDGHSRQLVRGGQIRF